MTLRNQGWYNLNSGRSYPVDEAATWIGDDGDAVPDNILVDAKITFPDIVGEYLYVSGMTVTDTLVTVIFLASPTPAKSSSLASSASSVGIPPFTPIASISLLKSEIDLDRHYAVEALYPGVGGWVVFGEGINESFAARFTSVEQSMLDQHAARVYRTPPIPSLGKLGRATALTGLVRLIGGNDIEIVKEERTILGEDRDAIVIRLEDDQDRNVFGLYAGDCDRRPESQTCLKTPIEFINEVEPDCNGNITIKFLGDLIPACHVDDDGITLDYPLGTPDVCTEQDNLPDESGRITEPDDGCLPGSSFGSPSVPPEPPVSVSSISESEVSSSAEICTPLPYFEDFDDGIADDFVIKIGSFSIQDQTGAPPPPVSSSSITLVEGDYDIERFRFGAPFPVALSQGQPIEDERASSGVPERLKQTAFLQEIGDIVAFVFEAEEDMPIDRLGFAFAFGSSTTGNALTVGLQSVNAVGEPDGTYLTSGSILPPTGLATNPWEWVTVSSYSASRGQRLAIVIEVTADIKGANGTGFVTIESQSGARLNSGYGTTATVQGHGAITNWDGNPQNHPGNGTDGSPPYNINKNSNVNRLDGDWRRNPGPPVFGYRNGANRHGMPATLRNSSATTSQGGLKFNIPGPDNAGTFFKVKGFTVAVDGLGFFGTDQSARTAKLYDQDQVTVLATATWFFNHDLIAEDAFNNPDVSVNGFAAGIEVLFQDAELPELDFNKNYYLSFNNAAEFVETIAYYDHSADLGGATNANAWRGKGTWKFFQGFPGAFVERDDQLLVDLILSEWNTIAASSSESISSVSSSSSLSAGEEPTLGGCPFVPKGNLLKHMVTDKQRIDPAAVDTETIERTGQNSGTIVEVNGNLYTYAWAHEIWNGTSWDAAVIGTTQEIIIYQVSEDGLTMNEVGRINAINTVINAFNNFCIAASDAHNSLYFRLWDDLGNPTAVIGFDLNGGLQFNATIEDKDGNVFNSESILPFPGETKRRIAWVNPPGGAVGFQDSYTAYIRFASKTQLVAEVLLSKEDVATDIGEASLYAVVSGNLDFFGPARQDTRDTWFPFLVQVEVVGGDFAFGIYYYDYDTNSAVFVDFGQNTQDLISYPTNSYAGHTTEGELIFNGFYSESSSSIIDGGFFSPNRAFLVFDKDIGLDPADLKRAVPKDDLPSGGGNLDYMWLVDDGNFLAGSSPDWAVIDGETGDLLHDMSGWTDPGPQGQGTGPGLSGITTSLPQNILSEQSFWTAGAYPYEPDLSDLGKPLSYSVMYTKWTRACDAASSEPGTPPTVIGFNYVSTDPSRRNVALWDDCGSLPTNMKRCTVNVSLTNDFPSVNGGIVINYHTVPFPTRDEYFILELDLNAGGIMRLRRYTGTGFTSPLATTAPLGLQLDDVYTLEVTTEPGVPPEDQVILTCKVDGVTDPGISAQFTVATNNFLPADGRFGVGTNQAKTKFIDFKLEDYP